MFILLAVLLNLVFEEKTLYYSYDINLCDTQTSLLVCYYSTSLFFCDQLFLFLFPKEKGMTQIEDCNTTSSIHFALSTPPEYRPQDYYSTSLIFSSPGFFRKIWTDYKKGTLL